MKRTEQFIYAVIVWFCRLELQSWGRYWWSLGRYVMLDWMHNNSVLVVVFLNCYFLLIGWFGSLLFYTTFLQAYIKIAQAISSRAVSFGLSVTLLKLISMFFGLFLVFMILLLWFSCYHMSIATNKKSIGEWIHGNLWFTCWWW